MKNPSPASITTFALTPPQILLKTDLISHPVAHIGLSIVNHYKDPAGVHVLFGPWFGQAKYETVKLYVNGSLSPVHSEPVLDDKAPVELRLPSGLLVEDVNTLHCKVERLSGNIEKSEDLKVLYFVNAPGGDDPVVGGGHPALGISVSPTSVDAAQAAKGVTLTLDWPHKRLYDLVTVDCGGVPLIHRIEPTPQDPVPDLTKPIVLTLYTQHFANDPNNPQFLIKYNVVSQTDNFSGTTHEGKFDARDHWSVPYPIAVHLDRKELEMPILQEILGDNGDDPTEVDLGKLDDGPLWALIHLVDSIWKVGDEIRLVFTAEMNAGVVATHEETLPITQVPGQFSWEIPNEKVIAESIVRVRYEQIRGGNVIGASITAMATVTSQPDLPELVVDTSPLTLSGRNFTINHAAVNWTRTGNDPEGTAETRSATGGRPPYTYTSSDSAVVSVDSTGRIRSEDNGNATITVEDSGHQKKTIEVTALNVKTILYNLDYMNYAQAVTWIGFVNGVVFPSKDYSKPEADELLRRLSIKYSSGPEQNEWHLGVTLSNSWKNLLVEVSGPFDMAAAPERSARAMCFKQ